MGTSLIPSDRLPPPLSATNLVHELEPQEDIGVTDAAARIFDPEHRENSATSAYQEEQFGAAIAIDELDLDRSTIL